DMEVRALDREHRFTRGNVPDQVQHRRVSAWRGRAQREAADRTEMVLELARLRALDRPVPRVVHSGRHLVRKEVVASLEELDRQDADVVELLEHGPGARLGARLEGGGDARRGRDRATQDPLE